MEKKVLPKEKRKGIDGGEQLAAVTGIVWPAGRAVVDSGGG